MATVTLTLKDLLGRNHQMTVSKNMKVSNLLEKVKTNLGIPVSRISHQGRSLNRNRTLSDYLYIEYDKPFYLIPLMISGAPGKKGGTRRSKKSLNQTRRRR